MRVDVTTHAIMRYRERVLYRTKSEPDRKSSNAIEDAIRFRFEAAEEESEELLDELAPWLRRFHRHVPGYSSPRQLSMYRKDRIVFVWVQMPTHRLVVTVFRAVCRLCNKARCPHTPVHPNDGHKHRFQTKDGYQECSICQLRI